MNATTIETTTAPITLVEHALAGSHDVPPGKNGMLHFIAPSVIQVTDVHAPEGTEIVAVNLGKIELKRAEGESWADVLGRSPVLGEKTFIVVVGKNVSAEPCAIAATLFFEAHAPPSEPRASRAPTNVPQRQFGQPGPRPVRSTPAHAMPAIPEGNKRAASPQEIAQIFGPNVPGVGPGVGGHPPARGSAATGRVAPQNTPFVRRQPSRRGGPSGRAPGEPLARALAPVVHAPGQGPRPGGPRNAAAAPVQVTAGNGRPQGKPAQASRRVQVAGEGRRTPIAVQHPPIVTQAPPDVHDRSLEIVPGDGERAVSLLSGHALSLLRRIRHHAQLPKFSRASLVAAFTKSSSTPRYAGRGTVVAVVRGGDVQAALLAIQNAGVRTPEPARSRLIEALERALGIAGNLAAAQPLAAGEIVTEAAPALVPVAAIPEAPIAEQGAAVP